MMDELGIKSKDTFYKHRKELEDLQYITVEKQIKPDGKFERNIYYIEAVVNPDLEIEEKKPCPKNQDMEQKPCPNYRDTENRDTENQDTIINSTIINNSIILEEEEDYKGFNKSIIEKLKGQKQFKSLNPSHIKLLKEMKAVDFTDTMANKLIDELKNKWESDIDDIYPEVIEIGFWKYQKYIKTIDKPYSWLASTIWNDQQKTHSMDAIEFSSWKVVESETILELTYASQSNAQIEQSTITTENPKKKFW